MNAWRYFELLNDEGIDVSCFLLEAGSWVGPPEPVLWELESRENNSYPEYI